MSRLTIEAMLLAGDIGGTKTFMGLFAHDAVRPDAVDIRSYRTLDFPDLGALTKQFLTRRENGRSRHSKRPASELPARSTERARSSPTSPGSSMSMR